MLEIFLQLSIETKSQFDPVTIFSNETFFPARVLVDGGGLAADWLRGWGAASCWLEAGGRNWDFLGLSYVCHTLFDQVHGCCRTFYWNMEKLEKGTDCDVLYRWLWEGRKPKALILISLEEIELARNRTTVWKDIFVCGNLYEWSIPGRCDTEVLLSEEFN